ncbi:unnamed protein product [Urochloa humidicola]
MVRIRRILISSWNVRGLGDKDKCNDVKSNLSNRNLDVVCLQETKISSPTMFKMATFLPPGISSFSSLDAAGAFGGVITAWNPRSVSLSHAVPLRFSLTCFFSTANDAQALAVTNVYAPCNAAARPAFFDELRSVALMCDGPWLLLGDFNVARHALDKNNDNFDHASAALFNDTIDALWLQELPLLDRRFTWSNMRPIPMLVRLDCAFINAAWGASLFNSTLHSLPRPTSDHVPLLVTASSAAPVSQVFRYEKSWGLHAAFREAVHRAWLHPYAGDDPVQLLVRRLKWTRAICKKWAREHKRPNAVLAACDGVLEEARALSAPEFLLRRLVADRRSLAAKELVAYWRQRFSFKLCKFGDENTTFYHASASARLRSNKIPVLHDGATPVYTHAAKERLLHSFYSGLLGSDAPAVPPPELLSLLQPVSGLATLEAPFTASEVKEALWQMRLSSSPGPDGFGPAFYRAFWPLIEDSVMAVLHAFHDGKADLTCINQALAVLG